MSCKRLGEMFVSAHRELMSMDGEVKRLCRDHGMRNDSRRRILTCSRELATNMISHAGGGTLSWYDVEDQGKRGFAIVAVDTGPGIDDVERALVDGYSTRKGLGLGLGGVRRMMDDFRIETGPEGGTRVTAILWE